MNNFAIGELPLPGNLSRVFSNTNKLIENGKALDRAKYAKAGRGARYTEAGEFMGFWNNR